MHHVMIVLLTLSFAFGVANFFQYLYLYIRYPIRPLLYYLIIQACMDITVFFSDIHEYLAANLSHSGYLWILWHSYAFLWAPFFFYYYVRFIHEITESPMSRLKTGIYRGVAISMCLIIAIPFLNSRTDKILPLLVQEHYFVIYPVCLFVGFLSLYQFFSRYRKIQHPLNRSIVRILTWLLGGLFTPLVAAYLFFLDGKFKSIWLLSVLNVNFLGWNVVSFVMFLLYFKKIELKLWQPVRLTKMFSHSTPSGNIFSFSLKKYMKTKLPPKTAQKDLKRIEEFMHKEKPFLEAELSLVQLADLLEISRNRLSQILNEFKNQNFYDFINTYRVEEAKRLLERELDEGGILRIAFDAGFNSKATFYTAFKKNTGLNPLEYQTACLKKKKIKKRV